MVKGEKFSMERFCTKRRLNHHGAHMLDGNRMYVCGCMPQFRRGDGTLGPNGKMGTRVPDRGPTKSIWKRANVKSYLTRQEAK